MVEVLTEIKNAEASAEEQKREARRSAVQCREDAAVQGKKYLEDEIRKATAKAAEIEEQARQAAAAYIGQANEQWKRECEELTNGARGRMDAAANLIVERIVDSL